MAEPVTKLITAAVKERDARRRLYEAETALAKAPGEILSAEHEFEQHIMNLPHDGTPYEPLAFEWAKKVRASKRAEKSVQVAREELEAVSKEKTEALHELVESLD